MNVLHKPDGNKKVCFKGVILVLSLIDYLPHIVHGHEDRQAYK